MHTDMEARACDLAEYLLANNTTVRAAAKQFGVSKKAYISKAPFEIPTGKMYVGLENYIRGIKQTGLIQAFGWSLFITILSVAVIILCCSMCAWYICRVKTKFTKVLYMLCLFAMIVPFQMEMFTLSKIANMLHMGNPWGLIVIYLGFGAGLSVFMFTGFMKSMDVHQSIHSSKLYFRLQSRLV